MSPLLSEYDLALASRGRSRRLWAEHFLEIPKPSPQLEWETMRAFFKEKIKEELRSHDTSPRLIGAEFGDLHGEGVVDSLKKGMCLVSPTITSNRVVFSPERIAVDQEGESCRIDVLNVPFVANDWSDLTGNQLCHRTAGLASEWLRSIGFRLNEVKVRSWTPTLTQSGGLRFDPTDEVVPQDPDASGLGVIGKFIKEAKDVLSDPMTPPARGYPYPPLDQSFLLATEQARLACWSITSNPRFNLFARLYLEENSQHAHDLLRERVIRERVETPFPAGYPRGRQASTGETLFVAGSTIPVSANSESEVPRLGLSLLCLRFEEAGAVKTREFGFNTFATRCSSKEFLEFERLIAGHVTKSKPAVWCGDAEARSGVEAEIQSLLPQSAFAMISLQEHLAYEHPDLYGAAQTPEGLERMFGPTGAMKPEGWFNYPPVEETGLALVMALTKAKGSQVKAVKTRAIAQARHEIAAAVSASRGIAQRRLVHNELRGDTVIAAGGSEVTLVPCEMIDRALQGREALPSEARPKTRQLEKDPLSVHLQTTSVQQELAL